MRGEIEPPSKCRSFVVARSCVFCNRGLLFSRGDYCIDVTDPRATRCLPSLDSLCGLRPGCTNCPVARLCSNCLYNRLYSNRLPSSARFQIACGPVVQQDCPRHRLRQLREKGPMSSTAAASSRCQRSSGKGSARDGVLQSYTSKGIGRQGMGSFVRESYVSALCPVVLCLNLCTSEQGTGCSYLRCRLGPLCIFLGSHLSLSCCFRPLAPKMRPVFKSSIWNKWAQ